MRQKADAVLGEFEIIDREQRGRVLAVVEIKGYNADLGKPDRNGRSTVNQGFDYSKKTGARWVIISNFKETWLYESRFDGRYELFEFEGLSEKGTIKIHLLTGKDWIDSPYPVANGKATKISGGPRCGYRLSFVPRTCEYPVTICLALSLKAIKFLKSKLPIIIHRNSINNETVR